MADGGASTMILLVTSLLISGAASVVLLESWGSVAEASGNNSKGKVADAELGTHPSPNCSVSTTYKEVLSILQQEKSVTASFMQGNFKIDGEYEKYLLAMNGIRATKEWQNMQQALMSL